MLFDDTDDDLKDPTDEDLKDDELSDDEDGVKSLGSHTIPIVDVIDNTLEDESQFREPTGSPSVIGEEDSLSGSASDGEPVDIDDHMKAMGLEVDDVDETPKPLGED